MTVDFSQPSELTASPGPIQNEAGQCCGALVPHPQNAQVPVAANPFAAEDRVTTFSDVIFPRLNVTQATGELKDSFPIGSIVFGQTLPIFIAPVINAKTGQVDKPGSPPAIITILKFWPDKYCEKVVGSMHGQIVDSEEAVRAAGGTLSYKEYEAKKASGMKRFSPMATALVAVEKPETVADDETVFVYPVGDRKYALAIWSMSGTAYTNAAKAIFFTQKAVGCLRGGYPTYSFALSTRVQSREGNSWFIPVALPHKKSTPEFLEFAASVLSSPA